MRMRYSLKFGMLVMTCLACFLAYQAHYANVRRRAIDAIDEVESYVSPPESIAPRWLIELLGVEYFSRIEKVRGVYDKMSDEHLAIFSKLPELKHISTNHARMGSLVGTFSISGGGQMNDSPLVTDAGLAHLSKKNNLEALILFNTAVTDDGVAQLTSLRRLQYLKIASSEITDDSIPYLSQLQSLQRLWTSGTSITSSGVDRLRRALPNCEVISHGEDEGPTYAL